MKLKDKIIKLLKGAKEASIALANIDAKEKDAVLSKMSLVLLKNTKYLLSENAKDVSTARDSAKAFSESSKNKRQPAFLLDKFKNHDIEVIVDRITIHDDKLKNIYLIENLKPENFKKIFLYAGGEIGYEIVAEVNNGKLLKMEAYAESGYSDLFLVENDSIIYKSRTHFSY